ncbi:MAG: hypothetical protein ACPGVA_05105 [Pikeienuella sp.]
MSVAPETLPEVALRAPSDVMRLARMGSFFPTRLSFMRSMIRRLNAEQATVTRPVWEIDAHGYGRAVYSVDLGGYTYSLIAFATPLADEDRSDRVIAEAWDSTYVLFDGVPTTADLDRLQGEAPRQEAGRYTARELVLSRANKSQRLFNHVVERLRDGAQPDRAMVDSIGYLMRTTAVYGNGKFGIADRDRIADRAGLGGPFQAEMLTVWLIRGFTCDLVEHVGGSTIDPDIRRHFGIGNSTGLGMAPFLVTHPILLNAWMLARETAFARVLAAPVSPDAAAVFTALLPRAIAHIDAWNVEDTRQMPRIETLRSELAELSAEAAMLLTKGWPALVEWSGAKSLEMQELLVALMLEPHGDLVDGLTDCMATDREPRLDPTMRCDSFKSLVEDVFGWALAVDFAAKEETRRFWYVSEEKLEPRLGDRYTEEGADREQPLDIARQAQALHAALVAADGNETTATLLMRRPDLRMIAKRVQSAPFYPYAEIQDNLIGADCLPIDMLRCKLSFFGATKFDPKSDLWTRVTLFQGAPGFEDICAKDADDWSFPVLAGVR